VTEKELQSTVIEAMEWKGWRVYHTYDSRRSQPGFPDVVAVRGGRLMFVEFKSEKGKVKREQVDWLDALVKTSEVYLVRPSTQNEFMAVIDASGSLTCHWRNVRE
jgi:Holliday junction resolvase